MKKEFRKIVLVIIFIMASNSVLSQEFWQKLSDFDNASSISDLAEGTNERVYGRSIDGWIYYTENNHEEWIPIENIPDGAGINKIKASDSTGRVYAATGTWGLLYTNNLGTSWGIQNFGLNSPNTGLVPTVSHLEAKDAKLFVCFTGFSSGGEVESKLFYSPNGAETYQFLGILNSFIYDSRFTGNGTEMVVGTDNGVFYNPSVTTAGWSNIGFPGKVISNLEFKNNILYAAVSDGNQTKIHTSADLGENWAEIDNVPVWHTVKELKFDTENQTLYVVSEQGIHKHNNNSWVQISDSNKIEALALGNDENIIFSGPQMIGTNLYNANSGDTSALTQGLRLDINDMVVSGDNQLYLSSNVSPVLSKLNLNNLQWDSFSVPGNTTEYVVIHNLSESTDGQCLIGMNGYLLKTQNEGNQVEIIANSDSAPNDPVYGIFNAAEVFSNNNGIYLRQHSIQKNLNYTTDEGQSWNLLDPLAQGYEFFFIDEIHAKNESVYFLGRTSGSPENILISTENNGGSWTEFPGPQSSAIEKLFLDNDGKPYAYSVTDKIFKWNENTSTWAELNINLGNNPNKNIELAFDHENKLYVLYSGTLAPLPDEGIYRQNEDGTFQFIGFPLVEGNKIPLQKLSFNFENIPVAITKTPNGNNTSGIYFYSENPFLSVNENEEISWEIYPNPANTYLNIELNSQTASEIYLFDLSGKLLKRTAFTSRLDFMNLIPGMYILKIQLSSGETLTKKFIKK